MTRRALRVALAVAAAAALAAPARAAHDTSADPPQAVSADSRSAPPARADARAPCARTGRWTLCAAAADALELRDAQGTLVKRYGAPAAVRQLLVNGPRRSVVVLFDGVPELWEISLDPQAEPIFNGWVHDYRMGEGIAEAGYLGVRRIGVGEVPRDASLGDAALVPGGCCVVARVAGAPGTAALVVLHLQVRRVVARAETPGRPEPLRATARDDGTLAVPDPVRGRPWLIDARRVPVRID